jgi:hypothetical protein
MEIAEVYELLGYENMQNRKLEKEIINLKIRLSELGEDTL